MFLTRWLSSRSSRRCRSSAALAFADVVVDAEDQHRLAVAVALDDAAARGHPARRMKALHPVFAEIVVAAGQGIAKAGFWSSVDVARIDGGQDVARPEPGRTRQVEQFRRAAASHSIDVRAHIPDPAGQRCRFERRRRDAFPRARARPRRCAPLRVASFKVNRLAARPASACSWSSLACDGKARGFRSSTHSVPILAPATTHRRAGVEADMMLAGDQRIAGEARIRGRVGHHHGIVAGGDGVGAEGDVDRRFGLVEPEAGFEPLPLEIDQASPGRPAPASALRQGRVRRSKSGSAAVSSVSSPCSTASRCRSASTASAPRPAGSTLFPPCYSRQSPMPMPVFAVLPNTGLLRARLRNHPSREPLPDRVLPSALDRRQNETRIGHDQDHSRRQARQGRWGWHGLRILIAALLLAIAAWGIAEIYGEVAKTPATEQGSAPSG